MSDSSATTTTEKETTTNMQCHAYCAPRLSDKGVHKRCTRRPKNGTLFCGTHSECQSNGVVSDNETNNPLERVEVSLRCVDGILQYVDAQSNVYHTSDILEGVVDPRVVGTYSNTPTSAETVPDGTASVEIFAPYARYANASM